MEMLDTWAIVGDNRSIFILHEYVFINFLWADRHSPISPPKLGICILFTCTIDMCGFHGPEHLRLEKKVQAPNYLHKQIYEHGIYGVNGQSRKSPRGSETPILNTRIEVLTLFKINL